MCVWMRYWYYLVLVVLTGLHHWIQYIECPRAGIHDLSIWNYTAFTLNPMRRIRSCGYGGSDPVLISKNLIFLARYVQCKHCESLVTSHIRNPMKSLSISIQTNNGNVQTNWKIGKENPTGPGLESKTSRLYQCSSIWAIQPFDGAPH
jgi:hypothetical protein